MSMHADGFFATLLLGITAQADNPFQATDLSPDVSTSVYNATAQSLAAERDALGWAMHPFRGEIHGIDAPDGSTSSAYDLSADGRVVVGANRISWNEQKAFVWTPSTGNVIYDNMSDSGATSTVATAVSADGVYVAGVAIRDYRQESAFRWSLAGAEYFNAAPGREIDIAALSADGQVMVGTACGTNGSCSFNGRIKDATYSAAVSYQATQGIVPLVGPLGHDEVYGVDMSNDGKLILLSTIDDAYQYEEEPFDGLVKEPFLLSQTDGSLTPLGTPNIPRDLPPGRVELPYTRGFAISADGSTVVGASSYKHVVVETSFPYRTYNFPTEQAVLWSNGSGWIDLGDLARDSTAPYYSTERAIDVSGDGKIVIGSVSTYTRCTGSPGCSNSIPYNPSWEQFIWDEHRGMRDLTQVLQLDYGLDLSDWSFSDVTAISDDGTTLIGNGLQGESSFGAWRAVLHRNTPDGDINFDGDVDQHDYRRLVENLGATTDGGAVFYSDGDLNADGRVDDDDAHTLLGLYDYRSTGDFNADGFVDAADYTLWRERTGQPSNGIADANDDGQVDEEDWNAWRTNYGRVVDDIDGTAVPEPATGGLILFAYAVATAGGNRRVAWVAA